MGDRGTVSLTQHFSKEPLVAISATAVQLLLVFEIEVIEMRSE
ncbi:hypothetical protein PITC_006910 [Penicillium italicum]|uniref:Uncharacterized protein n=1 Tax=Penicillium italicum TaxID=40296 RepID=A0A0A2LNP8_PENIT|nr:hypothetical protein PITC_006910 [Penicillium italicum]